MISRKNNLYKVTLYGFNKNKKVGMIYKDTYVKDGIIYKNNGNENNLKKLKDIIVYKTKTGKYKEIITHKTIPFYMQKIKCWDYGYSRFETESKYILSEDTPIFFLMRKTIRMKKKNEMCFKEEFNFPPLTYVTSEDLEEYIEEKIDACKTSIDKLDYKKMWLLELNNIFKSAQEEYNEIANKNGYSKDYLTINGIEASTTKQRKEDKKNSVKIKSIKKKYNI